MTFKSSWIFEKSKKLDRKMWNLWFLGRFSVAIWNLHSSKIWDIFGIQNTDFLVFGLLLYLVKKL